MYKVLIISTSFDEQKMIEEIAQHHNPGGLSIETTASFAQESVWWATSGPDLLIIRLPDDELLQGYFYTKLRRDVPRQQKMILLTTSITTSLMQLSVEYLKVRMLKTPIEGFLLFQTVEDSLREYEVGKQQIHPRYLTDVSVDVRSDFKEGINKGTMKNLSMSGAYFEITEGRFPIKINDLVHLTLSMNVGKQYVFDAKIVWIKEIRAGSFGYGVTFVNKEDVYNNLLKGF